MSIEKMDLSRPTALSPAGQVLLSAADLIRKHGHVKNDLGGVDRGFCAVGAIINVTNREHGGLAMSKLSHHLRVNRYGAGGIPEWNNVQERTAEQVISALEAAALS